MGFLISGSLPDPLFTAQFRSGRVFCQLNRRTPSAKEKKGSSGIFRRRRRNGRSLRDKTEQLTFCLRMASRVVEMERGSRYDKMF
jgi:hypothetical protein